MLVKACLPGLTPTLSALPLPTFGTRHVFDRIAPLCMWCWDVGLDGLQHPIDELLDGDGDNPSPRQEQTGYKIIVLAVPGCPSCLFSRSVFR
jgi:hypothetical protein